MIWLLMGASTSRENKSIKWQGMCMQEIRSATKEKLCAPAQSVLCAQGRGGVSTVTALDLMDLPRCPLHKHHTAQEVGGLIYHLY